MGELSTRTPRSGRLHEMLAGLGRPQSLDPWSSSVRAMVVAIAISGAIYGAVMGTFLLDEPRRWWFVLFAAIKVPLLILFTTSICVPAYFVANTLLGLREDFARAMRAVLSGQAALTITLASFAPIVRVGYVSGLTHGQAQLFNAGLFGVATGVAQMVMLRHYRALIHGTGARGGRHRAMLWFWIALYVFVGIQSGWIMRPFIGRPGLEVAFFRSDAFTNAYVYFFRLAAGGR